jgi:acetylornithine deacetylase/succinyl-diaminopimelate desuccinylase-like protein
MPQCSEWIKLIEAACAIDSRTAEGAAGTVRVAEMFGERLVAMGFALEWLDTLPEEGKRGRHLRAVRNQGVSTKMLFLGHTDTVLSPAEVPAGGERRRLWRGNFVVSRPENGAL